MKSLKVANRLQKLRQQLIDQEIDAILISEPHNRRYLSDFDGSAGFLVITAEKAVLATDSRYTEQGKMQATIVLIFVVLVKSRYARTQRGFSGPQRQSQSRSGNQYLGAHRQLGSQCSSGLVALGFPSSRSDTGSPEYVLNL